MFFAVLISENRSSGLHYFGEQIDYFLKLNYYLVSKMYYNLTVNRLNYKYINTETEKSDLG